MELVYSLKQYRTNTVGTFARPALATDGIATPGLLSTPGEIGGVVGTIVPQGIVGGYSPARIMVMIEGDGSGQTLSTPVGGQGVEVWTMRPDAAGNNAWWLAYILNKGNQILVAAAGGGGGIHGGYIEGMFLDVIGSRLAIAGVVSAGALTYSFEPIEHIVQYIS